MCVLWYPSAQCWFACPYYYLRLPQANIPDVYLLNHYVYHRVLVPAESNVALKDKEMHTKYQDLPFELHRIYPEHAVRLVVLIMGYLVGKRHTRLSKLRSMPAS